MFNIKTIAKRYSRALFDLSVEEGTLAKTGGELKIIADAASGVPYFFKALSDKRISPGARVKAWSSISKLLGITRPVTDIVELLVRRNKITIFGEMVSDFFRRTEKFNHMAEIELITIDDSQSKYLQLNITKILMENLKISPIYTTKVDPSLIGGFSLRIGDTHFDASVRGKIEKIKTMLEG